MYYKNNPIYTFLLNAGIITSGTKMSDDARNVQLFEAAVKAARPEEKMKADTALGESALAYLAWLKEHRRMSDLQKEHTKNLKDIQAACPHTFIPESNLRDTSGPTQRCAACRKIG